MRTAQGNPKVTIVDIREPSEHAQGVVAGARLIPMGQLSKRLDELPRPATGETIMLVCATQSRSSRVAEQLRAAGFTNASYVHGGMVQWTARAWPTVKP